MAALVGIDLGGTQFRAVLAEADGTILVPGALVPYLNAEKITPQAELR